MADKKQFMKGLPLRLEVFRDNPKYPMFIAILRKKRKLRYMQALVCVRSELFGGQSCFLFWLLFQELLTHSLGITKDRATTHHVGLRVGLF